MMNSLVTILSNPEGVDEEEMRVMQEKQKLEAQRRGLQKEFEKY